MAEFESQSALLAAIVSLRDEGYRRLEAFTPVASRAVEDALGYPKTPLQRITLLGGLTGAAAAYLALWGTNAILYPLNIGSHPAHAAPAFIPITFETTVLLAGVGTFLGWAWLCRLPRLWHPVFEFKGFERASVDRWFLAVDSRDSHYVHDETLRRLSELGAHRVGPLGEDRARAAA
jgi:hypothetical protein